MALPCRVFVPKMQRGGFTPPHHVIPISTRRGGACSSSSCLHSNPDTARRVCPLPVASFPFRRVEEGNVPPRHVILPVSKQQGGACRECHGLPWGFPGEPIPVSVKTHTRGHRYGFPVGNPGVLLSFINYYYYST